MVRKIQLTYSPEAGDPHQRDYELKVPNTEGQTLTTRLSARDIYNLKKLVNTTRPRTKPSLQKWEKLAGLAKKLIND